MRRRLVALGALAVVILGIGIAVAASGGGGDSGADTGATGATSATGTTSATGPTGAAAEQFIREADAVCAETATDIAGLAAGSDSSEPSAADVAEEAQLIDSQLQQIERLDAPRDQEALLEEYLAALDDQGQALGDIELGLGNDDETTVASAQDRLAGAEAEAAAAAEAYGFDDCAGGTEIETDTEAVAPTETVAPAPAPAPVTEEPADLGEAIDQATTPTPEAPVVPETPTDGGTSGGTGTGSGGGGSGGGTGSGGVSGGGGTGGSGGESGGVSP